MTLLQPLRLAALGLATLAAALVSGFFYAYFCSVMVGFATAPPEVAIAAMQAINATVRNAPFAFSFFGTLGFGLLAGLLSLKTGARRSSIAIWGGTALYGIGGFLLTMTIHVPLNEGLATVTITPAAAAAIWHDYAGPWRVWNAARMLASIAALACYVWALCQILREETPARQRQRTA